MIWRSVTDAGLAFIKRWEKFEPKPYVCPAGKLTIGYGHVIHPGEHVDELTEPQASALLAADLTEAERSVLQYTTVPLTDGQFDALVSFVYNCGGGAFRDSTLRRLVNGGYHDQVPNELRKWDHDRGVVVHGLLDRRIAEGELYASVCGGEDHSG